MFLLFENYTRIRNSFYDNHGFSSDFVLYFYRMKITATNIAKPATLLWEGEELPTGIYKYPTSTPIYLDKEAVTGDIIGNPKVHGGLDKACYLFSRDQYPYWKNRYPNLDWDWGMFGENLTVEGLNEAQIRVGSIYRIGEALVQISQPREPCYKLGVRFKDQNIVKQFIDHGFPGTYVRILEKGQIKAGDTMKLVTLSPNTLTIKQFYELLFARKKNMEVLRLAVTNEAVPLYKRERFQKLLTKKETN